MSKKQFLISSSQWLGALVLIILIVLAIVAINLIDKQEYDTVSSFAVDEQVAEQFLSNLKEEEKKQYVKYKQDTVTVYLHNFDPNKVDSLELLQLGFKSYQAHNLLQYRRKGGKINSKEKLKSIYGIDTDSLLYAKIEPYIIIPVVQKDTIKKSEYIAVKKDTILELNSCDTADLQLLRGIRSVTAKRIVKHRRDLGGYIRVEQLKEFEDLSYLSDSVLSCFIVDTSLITPIKVNHAPLKILVNHPYMNYTQAEELYNLRRNEVKLNSIDRLKKLKSFTDEDIEKLRPYLSFE